MKSILQRDAAQNDIISAFDRYLQDANKKIAARFLTALDSLFSQLSAFPASGSSRYAQALGIDGLRDAVVTRFPYIVFYFDREQHVDVVRVLHQERDLANLILDETSSQK